MDTPADPATPLEEVYQAFFDDLAIHSTKPSTISRYPYNIVRFERWQVLFAYSEALGYVPNSLFAVGHDYPV